MDYRDLYKLRDRQTVNPKHNISSSDVGGRIKMSNESRAVRCNFNQQLRGLRGLVNIAYQWNRFTSMNGCQQICLGLMHLSQMNILGGWPQLLDGQLSTGIWQTFWEQKGERRLLGDKQRRRRVCDSWLLHVHQHRIHCLGRGHSLLLYAAWLTDWHSNSTPHPPLPINTPQCPHNTQVGEPFTSSPSRHC